MRKLVVRLGSTLILCGLFPALGALAVVPVRPAHALSNGVALTPPMGWNDWNAYGCKNNWQDVEQTTLYIHTSGLQAAGYTYVNIDGCWNDMVGLGTSDPNGAPLTNWPAQTPTEIDCNVVHGRMNGGTGPIFVNPVEFPPSSECANDGIQRVADYVHALGLKVGLWTDSTNNWNCQEIPGDLGYETIDANTYAAWGIDYLKSDWCGGNATPPGGGTPFFNQTAGTPLADGSTIPAGAAPTAQSHQAFAQFIYTRMRDALAATGRPIVFSMCNGYDALVQPQTWAAPVANLWRTTGDIQDSFTSMVSIVNQNDQYAADAGPGAWNDPDMLEIGNGGMTPAEDQAEFSLWAEMAAPLIMGTNLVTPTGGSEQQAYDLSIFGNADVIAVDQDPLGKQASVVSFDGTHLVLARPLANGDVAVVLFNEGDAGAPISTTASAIGLSSAPAYDLRDLWTHTATESAGTISAFVPPHAVEMYRISPAHNVQSNPPQVVVVPSAAATQLNAGATTTVQVAVTNNGRVAAPDAQVELAVPSGWQAQQLTAPARGALPPGGSMTATWQVTAPAAAAPIATATLTATASYRWTGETQTSQSLLPLPLVAPVQAPYLTANTTGEPATFAQLGNQFAIVAAGAGVATPADQYGAIYQPGGAGQTATVTTTVTGQPGAGRGARAGLMIRNDMASSASPEGVVLYVTPSFGGSAVQMGWNTGSGTTITQTSSSVHVSAYPVSLKLVRNGPAYTGYYSTDGGVTWTQVAAATLSAAAAAPTQDAGIFHTSATVGSPTEADFTGLDVR